jgi:hypothetical protein
MVSPMMAFRLKHSDKTQMYYSHGRAKVFSFFLRRVAGK